MFHEWWNKGVRAEAGPIKSAVCAINRHLQCMDYQHRGNTYTVRSFWLVSYKQFI